MRYYISNSVLGRKKWAELAVIYLSIITIYVSLLANFSIYYFTPALKVYWLFTYVLLYTFILLINPHIFTKNKYALIAFLSGWILFFLLYLLTNQMPPKGGLSVFVIECMMIIALNAKVLKKLFCVFCWTFSLFLIVSCIEFFIFIVFSKGIELAIVERKVLAIQIFHHLIFNVINAINPLPRFQSLVEEPGLLGTLCAFLLFGTENQKNLRFPWFVFLLSGLLSFSLAFYVLAFIYFIFKVQKAITILVLSILAIIGLFFFKNHADQLIIERIDNTENVDTRTTDTFDRFFYLSYVNNTIWMGNGSQSLPAQVVADGGNAGAKAFIFSYGIFSTFILFVIYSLIFFSHCRSLGKDSILFLFVFWLSFYQRQTIYTPYTMIAFIGAALLLKDKKRGEKKLKANEKSIVFD